MSGFDGWLALCQFLERFGGRPLGDGRISVEMPGAIQGRRQTIFLSCELVPPDLEMLRVSAPVSPLAGFGGDDLSSAIREIGTLKIGMVSLTMGEQDEVSQSDTVCLGATWPFVMLSESWAEGLLIYLAVMARAADTLSLKYGATVEESNPPAPEPAPPTSGRSWRAAMSVGGQAASEVGRRFARKPDKAPEEDGPTESNSAPQQPEASWRTAIASGGQAASEVGVWLGRQVAEVEPPGVPVTLDWSLGVGTPLRGLSSLRLPARLLANRLDALGRLGLTQDTLTVDGHEMRWERTASMVRTTALDMITSVTAERQVDRLLLMARAVPGKYRHALVSEVSDTLTALLLTMASELERRHGRDGELEFLQRPVLRSVSYQRRMRSSKPVDSGLFVSCLLAANPELSRSLFENARYHQIEIVDAPRPRAIDRAASLRGVAETLRARLSRVDMAALEAAPETPLESEIDDEIRDDLSP